VRPDDLDMSQAAELLDRIRRGSGAPPPPIDTRHDGGDNGDMEPRVKALEETMIQVRQDLAVMRSNYVTKADLSEVRGDLKAEIANSKSSIIMWVVGAIFLAQLLPALPTLIRALGWAQ